MHSSGHINYFTLHINFVISEKILKISMQETALGWIPGTCATSLKRISVEYVFIIENITEMFSFLLILVNF